MGIKVCKFGGTSLADASQILKVKAIIQADTTRRYVVPSAPGKRHPEDQKMTDLLYLVHQHASQNLPFTNIFELISTRYQTIISELGLAVDLTPLLQKIKADLEAGASADYAASRGEFLNGHIIAKMLDFTFLDPAELICFDTQGKFDPEKTQVAMSEKLSKTPNAVVPGFYGSQPNGEIKTFSRGGSDITGAIVARGAQADVYENWSDVSGLLMADPRIVDQPKTIEMVTYRELRELAYMGASVMHDEAIFPVREAGIPVNIRNTNDPSHPGTMIAPNTTPVENQGAITGIAGQKNFTVIAIEKAMMNAEKGYGRRILEILETNDISWEHMPSGIDTLSLVIADSQLKGKLDPLLNEIQLACKPDSLKAYPNMALVATVGRGMAHTPGMAAKIFATLAAEKINIRMIDQGSSELNIIVGIDAKDFEKSVKAIYKACV